MPAWSTSTARRPARATTSSRSASPAPATSRPSDIGALLPCWWGAPGHSSDPAVLRCGVRPDPPTTWATRSHAFAPRGPRRPSWELSRRPAPFQAGAGPAPFRRDLGRADLLPPLAPAGVVPDLLEEGGSGAADALAA